MAKQMEFNAPKNLNGHDTVITPAQLLDFLKTVQGAHGVKHEALHNPIHYLFDGEYFPFSSIYLEDNNIVLVHDSRAEVIE